MDIALYQPDIPQNLGAIMRLCACMGAKLHIIEPCGFPLDDNKIRRVGMDYITQVEIIRHRSWEKFREATKEKRLLLLSTKAEESIYIVKLQKDDVFLFGRESAGVPNEVVDSADILLKIPMQKGARSLNVAMSAAMVLGEALRQNQSL